MNYMNEKMRDTGPGERLATETKLGWFSIFCVISVLFRNSVCVLGSS